MSDFLVHNNLLVDLGAYGLNHKGVASGSVSEIYNNTVKTTGLVTTKADSYKQGISLSYHYGTSYTKVHDNYIEDTVGPGLKIAERDHLLYDNTIVGCGTGDDTRWGHGIYLQNYLSPSSGTIEVYDNIIVEATGYGISDNSGNGVSANLDRNLITECGDGEWENDGGGMTEGTGNDANVYYADADDICFQAWSDDSDYSNDDFTLCCEYDFDGSCEPAPTSTKSLQGIISNGVCVHCN
jgi:hypothetical protein